MSDRLDALLEAVREPEVFDEAFVQRVMRDVRADEQRRWGRRALRRPMVIGLAAAAIVTGGAVAAVVGSNPDAARREADAPRATARVIATQPPRVAASDGATTTKSSAAPVAPRASAPASVADALTDHSSSVTDEKTGLRLQTESYTTAFEVSKPQRVTVTLENTGEYPIAISGPRGCTMQVMAAPAGDEAGGGLDAPAYGGRSAWACAGSEEDPRVQAAEERFVLAPGEQRSADARISLSQAGRWDVSGVCHCSFEQVHPTPAPKDREPVAGLFERSVPPLLPESTEGQNLTTPPIRVRAD